MSRYLTKVEIVASYMRRSEDLPFEVVCTWRESFFERVQMRAIGSSYIGGGTMVQSWRSAEVKIGFATMEEATAYANETVKALGIGADQEPPVF